MTWGLGVVALAGLAQGQVRRVTPRPNYYIPGAMSLSATPSAVSLTLARGGVSGASAAISISSSWLLGLAATANLYAFFTTTTALTTAAGDAIPSANVLGQCPTGTPTSYSAFTQSGPFASGSSLQVFSRSVLVSINEQHTDALTLEVDLTTLPQTPAGVYGGTMYLQLQAF